MSLETPLVTLRVVPEFNGSALGAIEPDRKAFVVQSQDTRVLRGCRLWR